jgi:PKD repeat protein
MTSIKLTFLMFAVVLLSVNIQAQTSRSGNWCATDQQTQLLYNQNPALIQQNALIEQFILDNKNKIKSSINNKQAINFIIPVVWHVVTYNGAGALSKADIDDQMLTINEDFQRLNSDASSTRALFLPYAADIQVEFRLAHLDPNGNCTEGIVRVESPLTNSCVPRDDVKAVSYWDSKKYFNIWSVASIDPQGSPGSILGYGQFPTSGINSTYGVVIDNDNVNRIDRTLTHEIGHNLGLWHTFQDGCTGDCSTSGDKCCDTPPSIAATYGCNTNQNTCNTDYQGPDPWGGVDVVDQIENYMSYDMCQNMFSQDQKVRMEFYLNSTSVSTGLNQLTTSANLAFTGTNDPYGPADCAPIADFSYDKELICEGSSVSFTDESYNAIPTGWNWTFTGGNPTSSSSANPTIVYNTPGIYSVTHQPSTSVGSDVITKSNIITVSSLTADYSGPIIDGFENTTQFNNDWIIENGTDPYNWESFSGAAATGTKSIRILNYYTTTSDVDYIISPSFDLSASSNKNVKFKVAFAKKASGNTDRLMIYYSLDCGGTWMLKLPVTTSTLVTAPIHSNGFVPTSSEWVEKTMDFTAQGSSTNIRFKFQFEAGGGNNIYLDDINIGGATGIDDLLDNIGSFNVYPNPTNSSAIVSFNLNKDVKNLSVKLRDVLGNEVANVVNNQSFTIGKYTLKIDEGEKLSSGVYLVEFNADNNIKTQKLIVQ